MRIGIGVGDIAGRGTSLDTQVEQIRALAGRGFPSVWLAQMFGGDALTTIAVAGSQVPGIEFGTAVVPTYPRHPTTLASQALTAQVAIGGRLTLGIGLCRSSFEAAIEPEFRGRLRAIAASSRTCSAWTTRSRPGTCVST